MRRALIAVAGGAVLAGAAGGWLLSREQAATSRPDVAKPRSVPKPTLYCDFFNFMHNATVVSFYFDVDAGHDPKYTELYVVENEGQKTEFGGPGQPPAPRWSYTIDEGTPTIASPDGATRIVLYGLKPNAGGVFWIEAGVRSDSYRNLEGKCRQAHYVASASDAKH